MALLACTLTHPLARPCTPWLQGLAALWPQLLRPRTHAPGQPATMAAAKVASVGSWVSPISSKLLTAHSKRLGAVSIGSGGQVFWLEGRPAEQGRQVLVTRWGARGAGSQGRGPGVGHTV